jgi:hypothetical protein
MLYRLWQVAIELPEDFRDESICTFRDEATSESLVVDFPKEDASPRDVVAGRTRKVVDIYGAGDFGPIQDVVTPAGPGAWVTGTAEVPARIETAMAAVQIGPNLSSLAFLDATGPSGEALLLTALRTASLVEAPRQPPAQGFARRYAGRLAIEVPASYSVPKAFRFAADPIVLDVFLEAPLDWQAPRPEEVAYVENGHLALEQVDGPTDVSVDGRRGMDALWAFVEYDPQRHPVERHCVRQLATELGDGTFLRIRGRTSHAGWRHLTDVWRTLVASIRFHRGDG